MKNKIESEIESIALRWMKNEGLSYVEARAMAIEEIDFYTDEKPSWKGPDDRIQEYI